jgi:DeoR/GlpR family transcriptional regulator of sugar metabolism
LTNTKRMVERASRKTAQRSEFILQELLRAGSVSVEDLAQRLRVDASTIRRDFEKLEQQQLLKRVHGGAMQIDPLAYGAYAEGLMFQSSMQQQVEEQMRIALAAARTIEPGDSIALSPGTATTHLARVIRQMPIVRLTIVTNALNIAMELAGLRDISLTLVGGLLLPECFAAVGPMAEQHLHELYTSKAFISAHGLSVEHGLTGHNQLEALTIRAMMQRARRTIVLADHTKIGHVALYRSAPITAMQTLITDSAAPPEIVQELERLGIGVQVV